MVVVDDASAPVWSLRATRGTAAVAAYAQTGESYGSVVRISEDRSLSEEASWTTEFVGVRISPSTVQALGTWAQRESKELWARGALSVAEFELLAGGADSLHLQFGPRTDLILGAGQTACLVTARCAGSAARLVFATDITCLEQLAHDIAIAGRSSGC